MSNLDVVQLHRLMFPIGCLNKLSFLSHVCGQNGSPAFGSQLACLLVPARSTACCASVAAASQVC